MKTYFLKNKPVIKLVLLFALLRFLISFHFELGTDEAHYVLYGRHLALSYFDHPPLVGWIHYVFLNLFSWLPVQVYARIPAILSSVAACLVLDQWLQRKNFDLRSRWNGLLALNIAILFSALAFFFLPDTILLILVPLISLTTEDVIKKPNLKSWLLFGATLGLAGLTKYTAILFIVPIAWYWIKEKRIKDFVSTRFWLAVFLAVIIISPVLIWNIRHDFISFKYQSGHVVSFQTINILAFLAAQASLFLALSFMYFYGFPKAKSNQDRFDFYLMTVPLVFFSFFALFENFLPHWTAPFFILALPWGVAQNFSQHNGLTKKLKLAFLLATVLFVFIHLELGFHMLPTSVSKDLNRDIQGWQDFTTRTLKLSTYPLAVTNWTFGSRVKLYAELAGRPNVIIMDHRTDQFDIWSADFPEAKNIFMLVEKKNESEFLNSIQCESQKNLGSDGPIFKGQTLVEFDLIECQNFSWKN